ncbi:MAG: rhodanese-like domain-containing protein [Eubacterium sp.]|nr:rhodanese-like domain-containing protein [Eubacterium sp.]
MMLGDISVIEETEETSDTNESSEDGPQNSSGIGPGSGSSSAKKSDKIDYVEVDGYKQVTQETAQTLMANNSDYIILDVREDTEYYDGHIPGAINISNNGIADKELSELPDKDQMILVYCRSGRRSKDAARKLAKIGYTNVYEFGGINDWTGDITME